MSSPSVPEGVEVLGHHDPDVLSAGALALVAALERRFGARRRELLAVRAERQARLDAGEELGFLAETAHVREGDWTVAPPSPGLTDRRVEITGPTDAKMVINALNSGATGFMSDFEDSNTPTWSNLVQGQANLRAAVARTLSFTSPEGKTYELGEELATLLVRPRGWHLEERHVTVDGQPVSGSLFDIGVFCAHNAKKLSDLGKGPYFYLPKVESHLEARLWNDVLDLIEDETHLERGTTKATILLETFPAAFEMDEILYELRTHSCSLNAGRWDYLFSAIKSNRTRADRILPDRNSVTMTVPFMRAYTELLVKTCHKRGAHAMGGMAAFIPSRRDPDLNEKALAKVAEDKRREATAGFDGTWVAHPDLVPTAIAEFDAVLQGRPNQIDRQRPEVAVTAEELLDIASAGSDCTEAGLRNSVSVSIQYLSSWLRGSGAVGINNLMEDVATAEISRAQVWQWVHHGVELTDGRTVTADLVREVANEELAAIREAVGEQAWASSRAADAMSLFEEVCLSEELVDFLTLPAYDRL